MDQNARVVTRQSGWRSPSRLSARRPRNPVMPPVHARAVSGAGLRVRGGARGSRVLPAASHSRPFGRGLCRCSSNCIALTAEAHGYTAKRPVVRTGTSGRHDLAGRGEELADTSRARHGVLAGRERSADFCSRTENIESLLMIPAGARPFHSGCHAAPVRRERRPPAGHSTRSLAGELRATTLPIRQPAL